MADYEDMSVYELAKEMLLDEGERDIADYLSEGDDDVDSMEPPLELDESFPCTVVFAGLPRVNQQKFEKLQNFLAGKIKSFGKTEDFQIEMPFDPEDPNGLTYGCAIVTLPNEEAARGVLMVDPKFDKAHTVTVVTLDKYDEIVKRPDQGRFQHSLKRLPRGDFRTWLSDSKCREQLLLRYKTETEVYWHDPMVGQPVLYYGGENQKVGQPGQIWCDWSVGWSPKGSYIYTFHKQGLKVWGGPEFGTAMRLPHERVSDIDWSPNEEFVLLWNGAYEQADPETHVRIYHVLTGRCVRECRTPKMSPKPGTEFPHFLWSSDGKYIAEMTDFFIRVRDTETWEVIKDADDKPAVLKFNNLQTFQWSPKGNVLAAWTLEKDNNPARLTLVEIPSRNELASRSRTQCEAVMHWQSEGDYLCLQVTKLTKTGKRVSTNVEILRVREKQVPVDVVTIEDVVRGFFWETKGRRFAVLTADEQGHKPKLLIYALGQEKCEQIVCFDLPSASFNEVVWAPEGQYFVVVSKNVTSGDLLFAGLTPDNRLEILHKEEHWMLTDVQWDPSSRYILTAVTQPISNEQSGYKYSMEAGYSIWTFQGRNLFRQQKEKLYHVSWRPHPPPMTEKEKQKYIRQNLKTFSKQYDALDDKAKETARLQFRRERDEKIRSFKEVLSRLAVFKEEKEEENGWGELSAQFHEEMGWTQEEDRQEELLDVSEEFIAQT